MYGLYIHIPFCRKKCFYCDFVSFPLNISLLDMYLNALFCEMEMYKNYPISTVYVGGGTPSLLSEFQIRLLFEKIRSIFSCSRLSEVTVEANPESLSKEKLTAFKSVGVNRLSIGVQSFNDFDLKYLGRVHSIKDVESALSYALKLGIENISIDLISGLPGHTMNDWISNLKKAMACDLKHISIYPLTIEDDTFFKLSSEEVDEEKQAVMYEQTLDFLDSRGFEHYEISNWCKTGYKSRHNLNYWENGEYIGLGVSASSHLAGKRQKNVNNLEKYISLISTGKNAVNETDYIDGSKRLSEDIILKLRCRDGIEVSDRISEKYGNTIIKLKRDNLLENRTDCLRLTRKGLLLANQVMKEFV